jgi:ribosomal protein S18 acetylase RimI-like enzyme
MEIEYKIKTASEEAILMHLRECNNNFFPPLTERVIIEEYSRKIFEKSITFEAWKEHLLVGLIAAYFNKEAGRSVFITNVSVLEDFMHLGIASGLLRRCIEYAASNKFEEISLEVNKENIPAIGLYRKFDFIDIGESNSFFKMKMVLTNDI